MSGSLSSKDFFRRKPSKTQKESLNPFYHSDDSNFYSSDYFHCIWLHSTLLLRVPTNGAVKLALQLHFSDDDDDVIDDGDNRDDDDGNDEKNDSDDNDETIMMIVTLAMVMMSSKLVNFACLRVFGISIFEEISFIDPERGVGEV